MKDHKFITSTRVCAMCGISWNDYGYGWPKTQNCEGPKAPRIIVNLQEVIKKYSEFSPFVEETPTPISTTCQHQYVTYTGLREQFEYCRICDDRKK